MRSADRNSGNFQNELRLDLALLRTELDTDRDPRGDSGYPDGLSYKATKIQRTMTTPKELPD